MEKLGEKALLNTFEESVLKLYKTEEEMKLYKDLRKEILRRIKSDK